MQLTQQLEVGDQVLPTDDLRGGAPRHALHTEFQSAHKPGHAALEGPVLSEPQVLEVSH